MQIKITTQQMMKVLYMLSWIIFIGVCVEAGVFICYAILTLILSADDARHLWHPVDLSGLYKYDTGYFLVVSLFMSIVALMRVLMFYLIIKILHEKKINMAQPFNYALRSFITTMSYLALGIGLFSWWGAGYSQWLTGKGVHMPAIESLRLGGADVWLFMGVILLVIAQIFKRGVEMQTENELTV
jgi:hypothetical protein